MNSQSPVFLLSILVVIFVTSLSCDNKKGSKVLFQDALNGKAVSGWKVPPKSFVNHPIYGKVYQIKSTSNDDGQEYFAKDQPWIGDKTWKNYQVEIEILPTGGHWVGLDCHVQDDGESGFNICFFTFDTTKFVTMEAMSFEGGYANGAAAWKLWPVSQGKVLVQKDQWIKFRIDVGETIVNAYLNDDTKPVFTVYDMPYSCGGVRLFSLSNGKAYLRNFQVTLLSKGDVKPVLADEWKDVRGLNIIRNWEVTPPRSSEFGLENIPEEIYSPKMKWIKAETDDRGVVNLGALFPEQNRKGTIFAKTIVNSEKDEVRKAWATYTDRCTIWCNGKNVFKGPGRGWNDPESNHDCRLKPDNFEIELPLKKGENVILLRSEVIENWGWGFWMRLE